MTTTTAPLDNMFSVLGTALQSVIDETIALRAQRESTNGAHLFMCPCCREITAKEWIRVPMEPVFVPGHVTSMVNSSVLLTGQTTHLFVTVFPNELPTPRSHHPVFCMISLAWPQNIIVGIEYINGNTHNDTAAEFSRTSTIRGHVSKLKALPGCEHAKIVFDIEDGTGFTGNVVANDVMKMYPYAELMQTRRAVMKQANDQMSLDHTIIVPVRYPSFTQTLGGIIMTRTLLEKGQIQVLNEMITSSANRQELLSELGQQLRDTVRVIIPRENHNGEYTTRYVGRYPERDQTLRHVFCRVVYLPYSYGTHTGSEESM